MGSAVWRAMRAHVYCLRLQGLSLRERFYQVACRGRQVCFLVFLRVYAAWLMCLGGGGIDA